MTNAELKKELSKYPDDAEVVMYDDFGHPYNASRVKDWSKYIPNTILID